MTAFPDNPGGRIPIVRRVHPVIRWLSYLYLIPRREWLRRQVHATVVERIRDIELIVPPEVFNPVVFRTGRLFSEFLADSELASTTQFNRVPSPRALDCTTGTGAQAIALARRGFRVTAVDINPIAVRAARTNVGLNRVGHVVNVLEGDLFQPVLDGRFELVVSALPSFRGQPRNPFDLSWRSPDIIERFAEGLTKVLCPGGYSLALFTSDGDQEGFFRALECNALSADVAWEKHMGNEIVTVYQIRPEESPNNHGAGNPG